MAIDRRKLEKNLPKKGFKRDPSGDHIFFRFYIRGKETIAYTKISHSRKFKTIPDGLMFAVRKQLQLETNKQVEDLVNCHLNKEGYEAILKKNGII